MMKTATKRAIHRRFGTGSVHQRDSDGLWIGKVRAGYLPSGAPESKTVSAKSEREAHRRLDELRAELDLGIRGP